MLEKRGNTTEEEAAAAAAATAAAEGMITTDEDDDYCFSFLRASLSIGMEIIDEDGDGIIIGVVSCGGTAGGSPNVITLGDVMI